MCDTEKFGPSSIGIGAGDGTRALDEGFADFEMGTGLCPASDRAPRVWGEAGGEEKLYQYV